jgi:hypothetical protein
LLEQKDSQEGIQILHLRRKEEGFISLESECLRSSGEIALCVREDSAEVQKSKNPLRIRRISSGGVVLSAHRAIAARSAEAEELFEEFRVPKAQEGQRFHIRAGRTQVVEFAEKKEGKGRGL